MMSYGFLLPPQIQPDQREKNSTNWKFSSPDALATSSYSIIIR